MKTLRVKEEAVRPRNIGKRRFLNSLLGLTFISGFAGALYTVFKFLYPSERSRGIEENIVKIAKVSDVLPGRSIKFRYGRYPCLLVNHNGKFLAYGAVCTHLACIVHWKDEDGCIMNMGDQIHCVVPCGPFRSANGKGHCRTPPEPFAEDEPAYKGGEILATGWDDSNYVKRISTYT